MTLRRKVLAWALVGFAVALMAFAVISIQVLKSQWFSSYVRAKIVYVVEESTGGRVEIGSFQFDWHHLHATVANFVLHGLEGPSTQPLFRADKIELRLTLLAGLKRAVTLDYVGVDRPSANVIVLPDGRTNIPEPRVGKRSDKNGLEAIVDLAVGKFDVSDGSAALFEKKIGFAARGERLQIQFLYRGTVPGYQGKVTIGSLQLAPARGERWTASVDLPMEIGKDRIDVQNARIKSDASELLLTASIVHVDRPIIEGHAIAHVALREVQRATGAVMEPCKNNTPCSADATLAATFDGRALRISNADVRVGRTTLKASGGTSGTQFNASVALDELGRLFHIQDPPHGEITLTGTALNLGTESYELRGNMTGKDLGLSNSHPGLDRIRFSSRVNANRNGVDLEALRIGILGGDLEGDASLVGFTRLRYRGRLHSVKLSDLQRNVSRARSFYDGSVSGTLQADGDLRVSGATGISAQAQLSIVPGSQGVPVTGTIYAGYNGAQNSVRLQRSYIVLPHSRFELTGVIGDRVLVDFSSTGLDDLYPAIVMASNNPPIEMPVMLHGGKLSIRAEATGALASPKISARLDADHFIVEQRSFDHLTADVIASSTGATIPKAVLTHRDLKAQFSGSLGLKQWSAQCDSAITISVDMKDGDIADVLALADQPDIRGRGSIDLSARINGTLGNPQGSAYVLALDGSLFDQHFDRLEGTVELADQLVRLKALDVAAQAAFLHATGTYTHPRETLGSGGARIELNETGLELGQIDGLQKLHPGLSGSVTLNAVVAGDIRQGAAGEDFAPSEIRGELTARNIRDNTFHDNTQTYGDLTARAVTTGSETTFTLDSTIAGASTSISGITQLAKDYPTTASGSVKNLRIENALSLAGETFPARGLLTMSAHASGPITNPSVDSQISLTSANVSGEPINNLTASLRYSTLAIEVPSLRVVGPAGDLTFHGVFAHPANNFDSGKFEFHAQSDAIRFDRIHYLQQARPGVGGRLALSGDFAGEIKNNREISLAKCDSNVKITGITYNGRPYGNASLVTETRGQSVAFTADSNFAGAIIHGQGSGKLDSDFPITAKLTIANLHYSNLREWLGDNSTQPGFEALVEAEASVEGPVMKAEALRGNVQLTRFELSATPRSTLQPTILLKNDGAIAIDYDHGSMRIRNAHLTGKSTDVAVSGTAAIGAGPLNVTIKANSDLGLLQDLDRDIRASGSVSANATVRGTFVQPLTNGTVQFQNASINMESLPNGISNANGVITVAGNRANVRNFTAESGGGKITLSGFAVRTDSTLRYSLNANATRVRTRYQGVSVVHSARITASGSSTKSLISGTVTVERVVYNSQSDIGSMLTQLTRSSTPNVSSNGSNAMAAMRLDVQIHTAPDVRFETSMAQSLQADADLTLGGSIQTPGMTGRINITQGDLIFFGNQYTVDHGVISFSDPSTIDPNISIDLETTVESVTVTLGVSGPMNNLKLSYHSDPPLQFEEIVGLLTTGKRPSSDPNIVATQAAPPQQSVAEMGESAIVSQAVASPLSSRLQRVFGVNQLRIDPTFASGSALPQARLTLQQRVANAVTFTYTQDLSQSNSELVRVEWAVNPRFSVVATRDENGIFGVDFFYKRQVR